MDQAIFIEGDKKPLTPERKRAGQTPIKGVIACLASCQWASELPSGRDLAQTTVKRATGWGFLLGRLHQIRKQSFEEFCFAKK